MSAVLAAPPSPYKGLAPFEDSELDALLFFGRERESEIIAANLMAARITVLYGPSGVGKSSVVRAGVAHRLRQEQEVEVVVFSTWTGDPVAALIDAVGGSGESLVDALADAAARAGGDLYLILDQFEECFLYHRRGGQFAAQLAEVVQRPGLRVNVLIGIREDSLARLDALKASIPNLLTNRLRLERLDRAAGTAAIIGPISRYNELVGPDDRVEIELELEDTILDEVTAGRVELSVAGRGVAVGGADENRIEAPYLQLVLSRLWDVEAERGSRMLTLATLRELGGAEHIVEDHLERAMAELSPREKGAAAAMYNFLVTPSGTKIAHGVSDLAGYASVDEGEASEVLQRLTAERIVRASSSNGPSTTRYEIFHDVLADAVLEWRARFEAERKLAEERARHLRRQRRLIAIGAAALLGLGVMAAIAVYAFAQRSEARHQAAVAKAQQVKAEHLAYVTDRARASERKAAKKAQAKQRQFQRAAARAEQQERRANNSAAAEGRARRRAQAAEATANTEARHLKKQTQIAQRETSKAELAEARTRRQKDIVHARQLEADARALLTDDPEASVRRSLAAVQAFRTARQSPVPVGDTLREGLLSLRLEAVLPGGGRVRVTQFSPDGSLLLVAGDGGARLYDRAHGFGVRRLAPTSSLADAAFSADGRLVAGAGTGTDHFVHVWDVQTGLQLYTLPHDEGVLSVAFSRNGHLLATGSRDGSARLWSVAGGLAVARFPHPSGMSRGDDVQMVTFSPDSTRLLTVGGDRFARVFDVARHEQIMALNQQAQVNVARFSPNGAVIATAGASEFVRIWDAKSGKELASLEGTGRVVDLAFSADSKLLATAGGNDTIARVWDLAKASSRGAVTVHRSGVESVSFSPDPSGASVLTTGRDGKAYIVRSDSGFVQAALLGHRASVNTAAFSSDGQSVLTASDDGRARLWDARVDRTGPWPPATPKEVGGQGAVNVVAVSRTGLAVSVGSDKVARLWLPGGRSVPLTPSGPVNDASFSRNSKLVITASQDGGARIWTTNGVLVKALVHGAAVNRARFSSDGHFVVTAGKDGFARLWRASGAPLYRLEQRAPVTDARFSPNGKLLVTGGDDGTAVIWRVSDGERLRTLSGHTDAVVAAAFSPSNAFVATGSEDQTVRVWDARSGNPVATLRVHQGSVNDVAFSADGRWLATAGPGAAGIWETSKTATWPAQPIYLVRPPTLRINDVVFSPHGWRLMIGSRDGLHAYDCKLCGGVKQLTAIARVRLGHIVRVKP